MELGSALQNNRIQQENRTSHLSRLQLSKFFVATKIEAKS